MRKLLFTTFFALTLFGQMQAQSDSLDIMIGQMILIGVNGTSVDATNETVKAVKEGKAGTVILFEKNIAKNDSWVELKKMTTSLQNATEIPLFIAIDQEGGRVNRLKPKYGFPRSVTHQYLGKTGSLDSTLFYTELMAATMAGLGINMNFGPVVDLESNPDNPIIAKYGRAFSPDPDSVVLHASAFIDAHRFYGVMTALKHFPGHGSSRADTHLGVADVTNYWTDDELYPYGILIMRGKVDAIMSAHIVNRKLDPSGNPGTLSRPIITGVLRDSLGFDGVIFSDDMHMKAISEHYGLRESLKLAINAGIDIVSFSHNLPDTRESSAMKVHATIRDLVQSGEISEYRIRESYRRIMLLKARIAATF
ncbi:MAG: glycoside hydrolase family 3 protein [Cyclobacteriaceae bacterium]|nr:glycoside hydrolase family 3 protein [Cyclobacteriaceae bacterium]